MMINIFDLYQQFISKANVHQACHARPRDFVNWAHESQLELFNELVEDFQKSQIISDRITVFLDSVMVAVIPQSQQFWDLIKLPANYQNITSARIIKKNGQTCALKGVKQIDESGEKEFCNVYIDPDEMESLKIEQSSNLCEIPIEIIDNNRWSAICNHPRKKITCETPKMTQYTNGFKIAPKGCTTGVIIDFFRKPEKPVFNFQVTNPNQENEYYEYIEQGSKHLEWSEQLTPILLDKIIDKYYKFALIKEK
jgi:hypothetical protein